MIDAMRANIIIPINNTFFSMINIFNMAPPPITYIT